MYKVVITDFGAADSDPEQAVMNASGLDIDLVRLNYLRADELIPHIGDADGLIVQWAKIDRAAIDALARCKVISRYGVGVDMIDLKAAGERGIPVANVPDYCVDEVSTHAMAFLLMLNRHVLVQHAHVKTGRWGNVPGGAPERLAGQTLGIVGLGNIGRAVLKKARGFDLHVIAYDPYLSAQRAAELGVAQVSWEELLRRSDYITLHCPLTEETRHLVGRAQLALMKPTACLINMARGPIVDQAALYDALVNHRIAAAALDVLEQEPPAAGDPLVGLDNVIITPHSASWSAAAGLQLRRQTAQNVVDVLQGKLPYSIVNRKELGWTNAVR
jgi:D-3-phosphoglycerate dehydrogenase / 2-oxoglutarate reductase